MCESFLPSNNEIARWLSVPSAQSNTWAGKADPAAGSREDSPELRPDTDGLLSEEWKQNEKQLDRDWYDRCGAALLSRLFQAERTLHGCAQVAPAAWQLLCFSALLAALWQEDRSGEAAVVRRHHFVLQRD